VATYIARLSALESHRDAISRLGKNFCTKKRHDLWAKAKARASAQRLWEHALAMHTVNSSETKTIDIRTLPKARRPLPRKASPAAAMVHTPEKRSNGRLRLMVIAAAVLALLWWFFVA
jgi:hypothetical protein